MGKRRIVIAGKGTWLGAVKYKRKSKSLRKRRNASRNKYFSLYLEMQKEVR